MLYRFMAMATRPNTSRILFNTAFKSTVARPTTVAALSKSVLLRRSACQIKQFHSNTINYFASSHDWNTNKPSNVHPLIEKLQQHPHIMSELVDLTNLLQQKGVDISSGKKPSFMQVSYVVGARKDFFFY